MYVYMYVCINTYAFCMYVCIYVYMYVCMHVCMYVCTYACMLRLSVRVHQDMNLDEGECDVMPINPNLVGGARGSVAMALLLSASLESSGGRVCVSVLCMYECMLVCVCVCRSI